MAGWLGKLIGGAVKGIPGVGTGIELLSAGAGLIGGNKAQGKSDEMLKRAMAIKQQGWDDRAPLRARTLDMANQPMAQREDLSSVFSDPGNPYARTIARPAPLPAGPDRYQQQAQEIGDKRFAGELATLRRSQGGGVGDRLASDALSKYVTQNPNSQWGVGGANDLTRVAAPAPSAFRGRVAGLLGRMNPTTAIPQAPVPGAPDPGILRQAMARRRPHLGRF